MSQRLPPVVSLALIFGFFTILFGGMWAVGQARDAATLRAEVAASPFIFTPQPDGTVAITFKDDPSSPIIYHHSSGPFGTQIECPGGQPFRETGMHFENRVGSCLPQSGLPDGSRRFGGS